MESHVSLLSSLARGRVALAKTLIAWKYYYSKFKIPRIDMVGKDTEKSALIFAMCMVRSVVIKEFL